MTRARRWLKTCRASRAGCIRLRQGFGGQVAIPLLALGLQSCAAPSGNFPVGDWVGEDRAGDTMVYSLAHFRKDGSYSADERECFSQQTHDLTESGHWTFSGDTLNLTIENDDGRRVNYAVRYRTVSNDGHGHVLLSQIEGGGALARSAPRVLKLQRVRADSALPDCNADS